MATTQSLLRGKRNTEAINNSGLPWSDTECWVELLLAALGAATATDNYISLTQVITNSTLTLPALTPVSWSLTVISGSCVISGLAQPSTTIPPGITIGGGGYGSRTLGSSILIDTTGVGTAILVYDRLN